MAEYAKLVRADNSPDSTEAVRVITLIDKGGLEDWLIAQPPRARAAITAQGFTAKPNSHAIVPGDAPDDWGVVAGVADRTRLSSYCLAHIAERLPAGSYRLAEGQNVGAAALGWMLAHYRFDAYRTPKEEKAPRILLTHDVAALPRMAMEAAAVARVRDMVNTPAADMGPDALEAAVTAVGTAYDAMVQVTRGDALATGYPLIHAVGKAAMRAHGPRLIELTAGPTDAPRVAIVGKGVCFDSGGLDLKPSSAMRLMKKDMGGAAHALALAELLLAARVPVRIHLLIAAVENAVGAEAMRPGDIIRSRKGLTVEIDNTDAEGRLVLADAFTRAAEESPAVMIDFATLTGAARAALGPDLPAMFSNDDGLAEQILVAGRAQDDPVWRMPLHGDYAEMLASDVADTANAGGTMAGAITAALFLQKFVEPGLAWAHFDTFAWRPAAKPARPKGGEALGLRAAFHMVLARFGAR